MKKLLLVLAGFLLILGMISGAHALPMPTYSSELYVGGFNNANAPKDPAIPDWIYPGGVTTTYPTYSGGLTTPFNDTLTNVNVLVTYNNFNTNPAPSPLLPVITGGTGDIDTPSNPLSGTISWDPLISYAYISMKYANTVDLWYIADATSFPFVGLDQGLSHYSLWNPGSSSVPEPATALLLGIGILGLAALGRKKIFKK
jgi:hypothetical protein